MDIGTGLPTRPNVHEVAQGIAPESRVVYVDNDPLVLTRARALLTSSPDGATRYADADLRDPLAILNDVDLQAGLELAEPGITLVFDWRPDDESGPRPPDAFAALYAGVARVP